MEAKKCIEIFNRAIGDYHVSDHIDAKLQTISRRKFEAYFTQMLDRHGTMAYGRPHKKSILMRIRE